MTTVNVTHENYAVRYTHIEFGARPDLTHPELVSHELSNRSKVVAEYNNLEDAYRAAHRLIADKVCQGDVEVVRITHHDPIRTKDTGNLFAYLDDDEAEPLMCTMSITASDTVRGIIPHYANDKFSRYHPVNGWVIPTTIDINVEMYESFMD